MHSAVDIGASGAASESHEAMTVPPPAYASLEGVPLPRPEPPTETVLVFEPNVPPPMYLSKQEYEAGVDTMPGTSSSPEDAVKADADEGGRSASTAGIFMLSLIFMIGISYLVLFPVAIVPSVRLSFTSRLIILCVQTGLSFLCALITFLAVWAGIQAKIRIVESLVWFFISCGASAATIALAVFPGYGFGTLAVTLTGIFAGVAGFCSHMVFLNSLGGWFEDGSMSLCMLKVLFFFVYLIVAFLGS